MSDEELIARLRIVTGFIRFETGDRIAASACLSEEAADRIEALIAERDRWKDACRSASRDLNIVVPDNDRLKSERDAAEAKLAKAVEFAEIAEKCGHGALYDLARTTLAEIKGESHD